VTTAVSNRAKIRPCQPTASIRFRRYLKAIEDGTFADIASRFAPDVVMEQLPIK